MPSPDGPQGEFDAASATIFYAKNVEKIAGTLALENELRGQAVDERRVRPLHYRTECDMSTRASSSAWRR